MQCYGDGDEAKKGDDGITDIFNTMMLMVMSDGEMENGNEKGNNCDDRNCKSSKVDNDSNEDESKNNR